jgi:hypothetical protein
MTFSRSHTGMIGIISLFTGMIAPVVANGNMSYPFPLTDLQTLSYVVLFLLAIGFYVVSTRRWDIFRIIALSLMVILWYMSSVAITDWIHSLQSWLILTDLRWGWIFVWVGSLSILYTLLWEDHIQDREWSIFSDTIIGIIGTITLIGLSALIIWASSKGLWTGSSWSVLEKVFPITWLTTSSGVTQSKAYSGILWLNFERKNDSISFVVPTETGAILEPTGTWYPWSNVLSSRIGWHSIVSSSIGTWIDTVQTSSGVTLYLSDNSILLGSGSSITIVSKDGYRSYSGISITWGGFVTSEDTGISAWVAQSPWGYVLQKDGITISEEYAKVYKLAISKSGYDTMALVRTQSGDLVVTKNGTPTENIRNGYREGSWDSNGSHSIYITEENDISRIIYDGVSIWKEFWEIREVFLEKSGNAYAFFARPIGESRYCIFTRFRGNLCNLAGYMNPRIGADGSSIIYAGLRDGIWGIYRNSDIIIRDTGYSHTDISRDYVFFDITNPKQYIFLEYNDGKYQVRKNWKIIPGIWNDVGLDVTFGYDNKVIMSAQDDAGWKVIEF